MSYFGHIAQSIVEQTSTVLELPMSITDEKGLIIGCSDLKRIGTFHEATTEVFKEGKVVQFTADNVIGRKNVLPGVATPIFYQRKPIGVLGIVGDPKDVIKYVYLVRNHVEMLIQETMKAESFSLQLKSTENFIQYLLYYRQSENKEELINYCEMMDFNLETPRICILIQIPDYVMEANVNKRSFKILQSDLFHLISKLFKDESDDIVTSINIKQWIVLKGIKDKNPTKIIEKSKYALKIINDFLQQNQLNSKAIIALGSCYKGIDGISRSYRQASKLVSIEEKTSLDSNVYSYYDWNVMMHCLVDEINPPFLSLMVENVAKLIDHPSGSMLISTFQAYCEQGLNMSKAARKLYIHRNTLIYRLNQINDILQMDIDSFEKCMFLHLALKGKQKV